MIQLPVHLVILWYGTRYLANNYKNKKNYLIKTGRGLNPSILELFQGILCFVLLILQVYFKTFTRTMIFILNPCHVTTLFFGIVSILPLCPLTEVLFPFAIGGCFGAYLGIIWAENGELSYLEHVSYYV